MAQVLAIGVATLDIINRVHHYPHEDEKLRALSRSLQRGGNAANTLVVLSQLGHNCCFAGVLSSSPDNNYILDDFRKHNIDSSLCPVALSGTTPASYIILNNANGSRTIVHHRDLREFNFNDYLKIDPAPYDWIHFEGREIDETLKMMSHTKKAFPDKTLSVELEKPRTGIETLIDFADTIFFSQSYANSQGFKNAKSFISKMHKTFGHKELVCTWGSGNTCAINHDGRLCAQTPCPPVKIIDTVAAGDTFIAGFIDARLNNQALDKSLESATRLAGRKCGQQGLEKLVKSDSD